jgi:hypothetical protein
LGPKDIVTVTTMCHIVEVVYMEKQNRKNHIRKLNAEQYVCLKTGEIKDFERTDHRGQLANSLRQTFKRLRYLINNNFTGAGNELHAVLTYAENMQDTEQLYTDMDKFIKRLRYRLRDKTTVDYISVVEPQERGAWHVHILLRLNDVKNAYIANTELAEIWGHGFVNVRSIKSVDNIGAYLTAYLTDLAIDYGSSADIEKAMITHGDKAVYKTVDGNEKAIIKGERIHLYPSGIKIYRTSRGIKMPERKRMRYEKAKKIVGHAEPIFEKTYDVKNDVFDSQMTIEQYNLKRIKSQPVNKGSGKSE